jgi:hypothetical protein
VKAHYAESSNIQLPTSKKKARREEEPSRTPPSEKRKASPTQEEFVPADWGDDDDDEPEMEEQKEPGVPGSASTLDPDADLEPVPVADTAPDHSEMQEVKRRAFEMVRW